MLRPSNPVGDTNSLACSVSNRPKRAKRIVVTSPAFDEDLVVVQRIKQFPVEQFISQFAIEGFDIAVLPRTARLDEQGRHGQHVIPGPQRRNDELRAVVAPNMRRAAADEKQLTQDLLDLP